MAGKIREERSRRQQISGNKSHARSENHTAPSRKEAIASQAKGHHHHGCEESRVDHEHKEKPQPDNIGHDHHPRRKSKAVAPDLAIHGSTSDPIGDLERQNSAVKLQAAARGKLARKKAGRKATVIAHEISGY